MREKNTKDGQKGENAKCYMKSIQEKLPFNHIHKYQPRDKSSRYLPIPLTLIPI